MTLTPTFATAAPLAPLIIGPPSDAQLDQLLAHPEQWPQAHALTTTIIHPDHNLIQIPDAILQARFAAMATQNLRLELEVGAVKEWSPEGSKTYDIEKPIWDRIIHLGGNLTSIAMDEPLVATRNLLHKPDDYGVEQTANFIARVRKDFPAMLVGDVEAYPFTNVADHINWLDNLNAALRKRGVRALDFYRIDPDWNAFSNTANWQGVKAIEQACRARKIPFSLIYWAAHDPNPNSYTAPPTEWTDEVLQQAAAYHAVGGRPDQVVMESWTGHPAQSIPETSRKSFTAAITTLAQMLK